MFCQFHPIPVTKLSNHQPSRGAAVARLQPWQTELVIDISIYLKQQDTGEGHGQLEELPSCPEPILTDIKIGTADISPGCIP